MNSQLLGKTQIKNPQPNANTVVSGTNGLLKNFDTLKVELVGYANINSFSYLANELQKPALLVVKVLEGDINGKYLTVKPSGSGKFQSSVGSVFSLKNAVINTGVPVDENHSADTDDIGFINNTLGRYEGPKSLALGVWYGKIYGEVIGAESYTHQSKLNDKEIKFNKDSVESWEKFHALQSKSFSAKKVEGSSILELLAESSDTSGPKPITAAHPNYAHIIKNKAQSDFHKEHAEHFEKLGHHQEAASHWQQHHAHEHNIKMLSETVDDKSKEKHSAIHEHNQMFNKNLSQAHSGPVSVKSVNSHGHVYEKEYDSPADAKKYIEKVGHNPIVKSGLTSVKHELSLAKHTFKPGDRVSVRGSGKKGTVVRISHTPDGHPVVEVKTEHGTKKYRRKDIFADSNR